MDWVYCKKTSSVRSKDVDFIFSFLFCHFESLNNLNKWHILGIRLESWDIWRLFSTSCCPKVWPHAFYFSIIEKSYFRWGLFSLSLSLSLSIYIPNLKTLWVMNWIYLLRIQIIKLFLVLLVIFSTLHFDVYIFANQT